MATSTLDPAKFRDPRVTADGSVRASVPPGQLDTLWVNTGTVCNLTCGHCYIESSPTNDRLAWITRGEVTPFLDEAVTRGVREVGFTGGEPFMNPDMLGMLEDVLGRGLQVLVLTNATVPLLRVREDVAALARMHGDRLTLRVSVDHHTDQVHEAERGERTFERTMGLLAWLTAQGVTVTVATRTLADGEQAVRRGFGELFAARGICLDAADPAQLIVFPELDETRDVPEITEACWGILGKSPDQVMCSSSRMVVKRRGAAAPVVLACTLIAYDPAFELGATLADADRPVALNHPHCATFCVLGGASCSA